MATVAAINRIIFGVEVTSTSAGTGAIDKASRSMKRFLGNIAQSQAVAAQLRIVAAGLNSVFNAIARSVADAAREFLTLENAMAMVQKITGFTDETIQSMNRNLALLSLRVPASLTELNKVAAIGATLGIRQQERLEKLAEVAAKTAAASVLSLEQATFAFAKLSAAMGFNIDESERVSSALLTTARSFATMEDTVLKISQRASTGARAIGLTAQELFVFSARLSEAGVLPEAAGTALSNLFARMLRDSQRFATASGIAFADFQKRIEGVQKGLEPASALILDFFEGFKKLNPEVTEFEQNMFKLIGGSVRLGSALRAISTDIGRLRGSFDEAQGAFKENTRLTRDLAIQQRTLGFQLKVVFDAWTNLRTSMVQTQREALLPVIKFVSSIAAKFLEMDEAMTGSIARVIVITAAFLKLSAVALGLASVLLILQAYEITLTTIAGLTASIAAKFLAVGIILAFVAVQIFKAWQENLFGIREVDDVLLPALTGIFDVLKSIALDVVGVLVAGFRLLAPIIVLIVELFAGIAPILLLLIKLVSAFIRIFITGMGPIISLMVTFAQILSVVLVPILKLILIVVTAITDLLSVIPGISFPKPPDLGDLADRRLAIDSDFLEPEGPLRGGGLGRILGPLRRSFGETQPPPSAVATPVEIVGGDDRTEEGRLVIGPQNAPATGGGFAALARDAGVQGPGQGAGASDLRDLADAVKKLGTGEAVGGRLPELIIPITTTLDGRVLSRSMQRINLQDRLQQGDPCEKFNNQNNNRCEKPESSYKNSNHIQCYAL